MKTIIVHTVHNIDGVDHDIIPSWDQIRNRRNALLEMTDKFALPDYSNNDVLAARVFLREIPQNFANELDAANALNDYDFPDVIFNA